MIAHFNAKLNSDRDKHPLGNYKSKSFLYINYQFLCTDYYLFIKY